MENLQGHNPETKLFIQAREWLQNNPGKDIPLDSWARKIEQYQLAGIDRYYLDAGDQSIEISSLTMVPVLALISLGADDQRVAEAIKHYGFDLNALNGIVSTQTGQDVNNAFARLDADLIVKSHVKALLLIPEHFDSIDKLALRIQSLSTMPLLESDNPRFWPVTKINAWLSQEPNVRLGQAERPEQTPAEYFKLRIAQGNRPSNDEILTLIHRAGYLCHQATRENWYSNGFFSTVLESALDWSDKDAKAIVGAINAVEDEALLALISRKIVTSMSLRSSNVIGGHEVAARVLPLLDPVKYADVLQDKVFRINLLDWPVPPENQSSSFHEVNEGTLLLDLNQELTSVRQGDFETHHFRALKKFSRYWTGAHDASGVDVNGLVMHLMKGLEAYLQEPRYNSGTHGAIASDCMADFLKVASKIASPDYSRLNELSSASKAIMCISGYNIRSFRGMTAQDKGRVITNDLGM